MGQYSKRKTRKPNPAYERRILGNPDKMRFGVRYARDVLKGRWRAWEARALVAAAQDDELLHCCVRYAAEVIRTPWDALEPLLLKAFRNGRTFEGEPEDGRLSISRRCMWEYLEKVKKTPWPELEPLVIRRYSWLCDGHMYIAASGRGPWPEFERKLLGRNRPELPEDQLAEIRWYCSQVIKTRWPKAERFIVRKVQAEANDNVARQAILYAAEVIKGLTGLDFLYQGI